MHLSSSETLACIHCKTFCFQAEECVVLHPKKNALDYWQDPIMRRSIEAPWNNTRKQDVD